MNIRILAFLIPICIIFNASAQTSDVLVKHVRNPDKSYSLYYEKSKPGTYHISVKINSIVNCFGDIYERNVYNDSGFLFQIKPENSNNEIQFNYTYSYQRGDPKPSYDKEFKYLLPFKKGKEVSLAKNVYMTNIENDEIHYMYSFNYSESTTADTIQVMRKGIVVEINNVYNFDPNAYSYIDEKRNKVIIEHVDGTYALYEGFKKNSIVVKVGQTVFPTDILGILEKSVDNKYRLFFDTYYSAYLSDILPEQNKYSKERVHRSLNSLFYTEKGPVVLGGRIYESSNYKTATTEEIICQEFTKKELKSRSKLLNK